MVIPTDVFFPETGSIAPIPELPVAVKDEDSLAKRFSRKNLFQKDLVFEFTRDPGLLHQYYQVRERIYSSIWGLTHFSGAETEYDKRGHIMVARIGNFCVGGVRLDVKTPRRPYHLPFETDSCNVEDCLPQYKNKEMSYAQISSLALLPEYHGGDVTFEILKRLVGKATALSVDVLLGTCPMQNTRLYRKAFAVMGRDTTIHYDVHLPEDPTTEGMRLYLMSCVLSEKASAGRIASEHFAKLQSSGNLEEV